MADYPQDGDAPEKTDDDKATDQSDTEILATARARFKVAAEAESDIRRDALDDLQFAVGEQWPNDIKNQRDADKRPSLVVNRLPQFIRQITNDQRQNRPAIKVSPIDDAGTVETAEVFQGLIRHIEDKSNADTAYDTAFDSAVRGGFGYFRVVSDYVNVNGFDQELLIKRIRNPMMVYKDPSSQEPDGSDANWYFVIEDLTLEEFEQAYGEIPPNSLEEFQSIGDDENWRPDGKIRVAEYFYKDYETKKIHLTSNGNVIDDAQKDHLPEGSVIKKTRVVQVPVIKWCKINAVKVLERQIWPGKWIPIIPVLGEEQDINGKITLAGIVRYAKDPQRMLNYWKSAETETIALAPRAPYVGAEGQFEGHEAQWRMANVKNQAFLQYKLVTIAGQAAPPPARQVYEPAVQAITNASMQAAQDIKDVTGIYDPTLGNRTADQSGIAIKRLNTQAQTTNFHFVDNLHRSLRHCGRILVDAIPYFYDTKRAVRIIGDDGETDIQVINAVLKQDGKLMAHNLDVGEYDVSIDSGPSYATKREEAVASMLDLAKSLPQLGQAAPDLLVKSMDWPHAKEIAERLKKMLPPQLQDQDPNKPPMDPQAQAQMKQMGSMIQTLSQALHAAHDKLDSKSVEVESRERIAMRQIQADIEIVLAKLGSSRADALLNAQIGEIETRLKYLNSGAPIDASANDSAAQPAPGPGPQNLGSGPAGALPPNAPTGGQAPGNPMGNTP